MKILVIGATGRTGNLFTHLATSKNHQVTAVIRWMAMAKFILDSLESEKYVRNIVTLSR